jgi:hypothetical protein
MHMPWWRGLSLVTIPVGLLALLNTSLVAPATMKARQSVSVEPLFWSDWIVPALWTALLVVSTFAVGYECAKSVARQEKEGEEIQRTLDDLQRRKD